MMLMAGSGSSPLARGLRRVLTSGDRPVGIIPARAGFTPPRTQPARRGPDHPRSRGVYGRARRTDTGSWGSSPLARGLLHAVDDAHGRLRIIPARAGFTLRGGQRGPRGPDHPRSRGVYGSMSMWFMMLSGSSPLARGLQSCTADGYRILGIIPARAGFTCASRQMFRVSADHPRSRGVYGVTYGAPNSSQGSSPLARGLPSGSSRHTESGRIIPARAGFTSRLVRA